jgi:ABC-type dipeptide/oligopeptide/nickel transport system ATPase component
MAVVRHLADDVAVMYRGQIVEQGAAAEVLDTPRHDYSQALMRSAMSGQAAPAVESLT